MKTTSELHDEAMQLAEEAFDASRQGKSDRAHRLFLKALERERSAAEAFEQQFGMEPTRSVLYRSAATLAFHAGLPDESVRLIAAGLAGNPPREIKQELKDLRKKVMTGDRMIAGLGRRSKTVAQITRNARKEPASVSKIRQVATFRYKQVDRAVSKFVRAKVKEPVKSATKTLGTKAGKATARGAKA